ncbi:MAG: hypothetical protein KC635_26280 [Myxococcales bacterium]|nr:hypothetical protein [Myxococcales bacterium]MCB9736388.1 hypothetical protein [Deltaproteobacteria bacterium]
MSPALAIVVAASLALGSAAGCGGADVDAPETPPPKACKRVDDHLARLHELQATGQLTHLADAVGGRLPDDARRDLLAAVLRLLGGFEEGTFSALAPVLDVLGEADGEGLQPTLGRVLRYVAVDSPAAPYPAALHDLRAILSTCEGAPVLGLLRRALEDDALVDALVAALGEAGGLADALDGLTFEGEDGREALRLLLRNLLVAASGPDFDVRTVIDLLALIVDVEASPWAELAGGLERLLGEEPGKSALRGLLVCVREVDPDVALGPLLYDVLAAGILTLPSDGGAGADGGATTGADTAPYRALLADALGFLEGDAPARRALATVGVELLRDDVAQGVLADLATLLSSEALTDVVEVLVLLATGTCEALP